MKKIVVIQASARTQDSHSRNLSEVFIDYWKKTVPNTSVTYRELGNRDIPPITENWLIAAAKPEATRSAKDRELLAFSTTCIKELWDADIIVLATPMYNWSIPSTLKAYIDQIMRVNETFTVHYENGKQVYEGLLKGKSLFLLLSRGGQGYEDGGYNANMNFQDTYLRMIFGMMGIRTIHESIIDGTSERGEALEKVIRTAHQKIRELVEQEVGSHAK